MQIGVIGLISLHIEILVNLEPVYINYIGSRIAPIIKILLFSIVHKLDIKYNGLPITSNPIETKVRNPGMFIVKYYTQYMKI